MPSKNAGAFWLASERVVAVLVGLLTTFLVARFMGPVDFGIFAFIFAAIGLGLAAGHLGIDSLLVRSFVNSDWTDAEIIGTAVAMKAVANIVGFVTVLLIVIASTDGSQTELAIVTMGVSVFALSSVTTVLGPWFKAKENFKALFDVRVLATVVSLVAKISVVATDMSIVAMAAAHILYFIAETFFLVLLFLRRNGTPLRQWTVRKSVARDLIARGMPLFFGTMIAVTYTNIDMIMIRYFWDPQSVGEYALVPQILNAIQIIPYALTSAALPMILTLVAQEAHSDVVRVCRALFGQLLLLAVASMLLVIFVARPLTPLVFGEAYQATLAPLLISAFGIPFIFIRHLNVKLFVAYDVRYDFVKMELAGLGLNIVLNLILIPLYAGSGAAVATAIAYFTSSILMVFMLKKSRAIFLPMLTGRAHD